MNDVYWNRDREAEAWAETRTKRDPPWKQLKQCIFCGGETIAVTLSDSTPLDCCASCAPFAQRLVRYVMGLADQKIKSEVAMATKKMRADTAIDRKHLYNVIASDISSALSRALGIDSPAVEKYCIDD